MKKTYHGIRVERVEIPIEAIITSSTGSCEYATNYTDEHMDPMEWNDYCNDHYNEILPYKYYNLNG